MNQARLLRRNNREIEYQTAWRGKPMTKRRIEMRLKEFGLRIERRDPPEFVEDVVRGNWFARWIVRPDTVGSCMAKEVTPLERLKDAEGLIDRLEISVFPAMRGWAIGCGL